MKIKTKLPLFTSITVLLSIAFIAIFSIVNFRNRTIENIENYRVEEIEKIKQQLKDIVYISFNMVAQSYESSSAKAIEETYGIRLDESGNDNIKMLAINILNITIENLRVLRYGVDGYIWINDIEPPYKVVMHATKSELEGSGHVYKIEGTDINVYEAFADICNESGEGFLEYSFFKPGQTERLPKMSFIKLFKPLGWVIGTGVYIDNIEKEVRKKTGALEQQINQLVWITIVIGIFLVAAASIFLYYLGSNVTNAIGQVNNQLLDMAKGHGVAKIDSERKDEIGEMNSSLNILIDGVSSYTAFANEIGKGNLDAKFTALSSGDQLGNSLIEMRESLRKAREEERIRQKENKIRNWIAEGQGLISDVIKGTGDDLNIISHKIISTLIRYLNSNQGGLLILNDDNPNDIHIELMASFAYNRSRFHHKRIELNEGVIGACFLEKKTIYMTKLPDDYMEIRSGLGTANPKSLLVVPLKIEENVIGIIEIASFKELEKHEIEFVEKVSESISSILFTSKTGKQTQELLEKFREQAAEKAYQDQEMQQKIEELEMLREKLKSEKHFQN
ncbi:MAG: cache domain-containing protein [Bacteroidales bacterium]|nr:cache domain-containing protein [Bacteroidales bacterium]MBN2755726.1 cache domain-containing protein [Bacteroidales bacterium]